MTNSKRYQRNKLENGYISVSIHYMVLENIIFRGYNTKQNCFCILIKYFKPWNNITDHW